MTKEERDKLRKKMIDNFGITISYFRVSELDLEYLLDRADKCDELEAKCNELYNELGKHFDVPKIEYLSDKVKELEAKCKIYEEALTIQKKMFR